MVRADSQNHCEKIRTGLPPCPYSHVVPLVPGRRGVFGDWLKTERERRYRTQADALADYRKLAGLVISPSEYAQWESGSRVPKDENPKRLALYAFYGSREDAPASPEPTGDATLAAAINRQTDAIRELAESIRFSFAALDANNQDRAKAITAFLARIEDALVPGGNTDGAGHQGGTQEQTRHRTQKKRQAGGPRQSWQSDDELSARSGSRSA